MDNKSTDGTVGIVGANSPVGTEVSLLLRERGWDIIPIVRNRRAAYFLSSQGFDCRIASITDSEDAKEALSDINAVVMAAFAWQFNTVKGFKPRQARGTNEALITNAVKYTPSDTNVVYYSSIAAFGDERLY